MSAFPEYIELISSLRSDSKSQRSGLLSNTLRYDGSDDGGSYGRPGWIPAGTVVLGDACVHKIMDHCHRVNEHFGSMSDS